MYCVWDIMFDELRRVFKSRIEYKYDGSVNPFVYFMRERDYRRLLESVWIQPSIVAMHRDGSSPLIDILASQCSGGSYHHVGTISRNDSGISFSYKTVRNIVWRKSTKKRVWNTSDLLDVPGFGVDVFVDFVFKRCIFNIIMESRAHNLCWDRLRRRGRRLDRCDHRGVQ